MRLSPGISAAAMALLMIATAGSTPIAAADEISPTSPVPGLKRVFRSSFEEPVTLKRLSGGSQARLANADDDGSAWDSLDHVFELVAPGALDSHVSISFSNARSSSGTRSLHMRQTLDRDGAQARLQFFGDDAEFGSEILTRRSYFVPSSNLNTLARQESSVSIAGTRETRGSTLPAGHPGADFSLPLYLVRLGNKLVFAQAVVDYSAGPNWSDWTRKPKGLLSYGAMTACPLDRWFQLDVYILRHTTHGTIKVWLDGKPIFNLENVRTKNDSGRWFTKLADVDTEPAPFELWVDEVEIWSR
jgi:hypothetical protein